jgi:hypothetical protein
MFQLKHCSFNAGCGAKYTQYVTICRWGMNANGLNMVRLAFQRSTLSIYHYV